MKKLFAVKDSRTGKVLPKFYDNKKAAKEHRNLLNEGYDPEHPAFVVTYGPDHHKSK